VSDLIDTTEMYLRTIFELEEEGIVPLRARIAERLGQTGPTVSQTVARMERGGLLSVSGDRHLELTPLGREKATRVMRKHRLAERLLLDVIGLEWEYVHDEACRWEHVMSDRVERKLLAMLADPRESPYGNPIPGLAELGGPADGAGFRVGVVPLPDALADDGQKELLVRRLGEPLQTDLDLMGRLSRVGVRPGLAVVARRSGSDVRIATAVGEVDVPAPAAHHVFVDVIEKGVPGSAVGVS
jgi:DtxR family transcriptional regulator, iron-dependent repressor